ncbi:acetyl-coenzyme a synthetase [Blastocladiella britannica]|nr:acetyl-coenzyme a synthetase [Blastocladiella britannica]
MPSSPITAHGPLSPSAGTGILGQTKYVKVPENDPSLSDEANAAPLYPVPPSVRDNGIVPHVASMEQYQSMYKESIGDPDAFFGRHAKELLTWHKEFSNVSEGNFEYGDVAWFADGSLNACYNAVDRWAAINPNKMAILHEPDTPGGETMNYTYKELQNDVCRLANVLLSHGMRKGDTVAIYLPMTPVAAVAMLACARLGIVHSVVFAGFSAEALRDRLMDANCRMLITADEGLRAGKSIPIKKIADAALKDASCVEKVLVFKRTGGAVTMKPSRDLWWHEELPRQRPYCPAPPHSAEDPLFMLYTSGSTGKPKGLLHTTAGYLLGAALTVKYVFDVHENDIYACMADVGWITGHTYATYGPLLLGATTVFFESVPTYPNPERYWKLVDDLKITQFYTAPTAIRALQRFGEEHVKKYSLSSLRVLGTVGEPINPSAWEWYNRVVGRGRTAIVDTYWQTETGSNVITPLPGAIPTKPGSATLPFFGIDAVIVDPTSGLELEGNSVTGVLCFRSPWPSMARTIYGDHQRYLDTYFNVYPSLYFTGDGATRDKDGYIWVRGRVDDVINVAGHRLSTAEVESALVAHDTCAESAVVGAPDEISGACIVAFVTLKVTHTPVEVIPTLLKEQVRRVIGPIATPKRVIVVPELPKTRSGKIMRRILRKIVEGQLETIGDTSTLADPSIIQILIEKYGAALA